MATETMTETKSTMDVPGVALSGDVPQLKPLLAPIGIKPDYITSSQAKIVVKQREYTSLGRDYTVYNAADDSVIFSVKASSLSKSQRRTFEDAAGTPLFDLRRHVLSKSKHWYLYRPGEDNDSLMTASIKCFSLKLGLDLKVRNAAAAEGGEETVEIREMGWHGERTSIKVGGVDVATMFRTAADGSSSQGVVERMSFRRRPIWTVHIAQGFDLSLAAVIAVICAEHYPEYHFVIT